ncbi:MAG: hypothetical protein FJX57_08140 [Alphaproteobacteria bacterium]|nr:hypothetical protein [Alphaproteobacteria bacterium]
MRKPLSELEGTSHDIAVIGAGANGASAAQHLAAAGYSATLVDLMFRRVGVAWTSPMGRDAAEKAAQAAASVMGWDARRVAAEAQAYRAHPDHLHQPRLPGQHRAVEPRA